MDGRQMAVTGFLSILNDQLKEIGSGDNDEQAAAAEGVAFEILGKKKYTRCNPFLFENSHPIRIVKKML